ncbi:hypothetical protein Tco_0954741 [Tanacetum coccineum]|uniref:Jacalin-type lectin domain-containing protein n=1 Tax=Tanacetum coccineum TaxID=301880 RepID=A0ABQ5E597_9ASTR
MVMEDRATDEKTNHDCFGKGAVLRNIRLGGRSRRSGLSEVLWAEDTTISTYLVNKVVLYRNMGFIESGEYKKTFIGSGVGTGSMQVLHGFEFKDSDYTTSGECRSRIVIEVEHLRSFYADFDGHRIGYDCAKGASKDSDYSKKMRQQEDIEALDQASIFSALKLGGVVLNLIEGLSKSRHDYDKRLLEAESGPPKTAGPSGRPKKTAGPSARPKKTTGRSSRNQATYLHSPATFSFGSRPSLFVPYSSAPRP